MPRPIIELPKNCANCQHFDGGNHCTLVLKQALIPGYIADPFLVVCAKHEAKDGE